MLDTIEPAKRDWVRRVLGVDSLAKHNEAAATPTAGATAASQPLSPVQIGKAALLWRANWAKADRDLKALADAVIEAIDSDEDFDPDSYETVEAQLRIVTGVTDHLNLSLAEDLDDIRNADPDAIGAPVAQLRKRLSEYENYLNTDEMIDLLASNEFMPVTVKADLLEAVRVVQAALPA